MLLKKVKAGVLRFLRKETAPADAYDLWAANYDAQPDNLMLALDEEVFSHLFNPIDIAGKNLIDIGCGTGRHWNKIYQKNPKTVTGYDVSKGMLGTLKQKFPQAKTFLINNETLTDTADHSHDILISTLTLAHIPDIENAFREWNRILIPGASVILTDYHPQTLAAGGNRTFSHQGKTISIVNHIHPVQKVQQTAARMGFKLITFTEKRIDDQVRHYYKKQQALSVYERFKGLEIIYGMHLKKINDIR